MQDALHGGGPRHDGRVFRLRMAVLAHLGWPIWPAIGLAVSLLPSKWFGPQAVVLWAVVLWAVVLWAVVLLAAPPPSE